MGIPLRLFGGSVSGDLLCRICNLVLEEPVLCENKVLICKNCSFGPLGKNYRKLPYPNNAVLGSLYDKLNDLCLGQLFDTTYMLLVKNQQLEYDNKQMWETISTMSDDYGNQGKQ